MPTQGMAQKNGIEFLLNPIEVAPQFNFHNIQSPHGKSSNYILEGGSPTTPSLISSFSLSVGKAKYINQSSYPRTPLSRQYVQTTRARSAVRDALSPLGSQNKKRLAATKKKSAICKIDGCTSLAVSRKCCVRHGGGSRCCIEGCSNGAKLHNRCFQHGGSTICLEPDCSSKAKRYGYCWSHGGGRICSTEGCTKVAAQGGACWAHGGGNRCRLDGCLKRSYQKHDYYCKIHAAYGSSQNENS